MKRTTILAEEELLLDTKYLAKQLGKTFTDVVREALAEYVTNHRPQGRRRFSIEGIGRSDGPVDWTNAREMIREDIRSGRINPLYGFTPGPEDGPATEEPSSRRPS